MAGEIFGSGVQTAPTTGTTIATIASGSLPAGKYRIETDCSVSNNAVADVGNMKLQRGGVDLVNPLPHGVNGQPARFVVDEVELDGTQALDIKAIGNATASIEYNATIEALRIA